MHFKRFLPKHRLSPPLSAAWAAAGWRVFLVVADHLALPNAGSGAFQFFACIAFAAMSLFMISARRLPYANNFEVVLGAGALTALLFLSALSMSGHPGSSRLFVVFFIALVLWFNLEVMFRNRFVAYRVAVLPCGIDLPRDDFAGCHVTFAPTPDAVKRHGSRAFDCVVADLDREWDAEWNVFFAACRADGIPVIPLAAFLENMWGRVLLEFATTRTMLESAPPRWYEMAKPATERLCALLGCVAALPLMAATAALVKATSRGPVLYRQERIGLGGKRFTIYKFRTMECGSPGLGGEAGGGAEAPRRLTRIGGFLRKYHLDEFPQLFNVLKGDMALVGPRPETATLSKIYAGTIPHYVYRTAMKPGITSWSHIHQGNVSGIAANRIKLSYDLFYLKHASAFLDLYILVKTAWVLLMGIETLERPGDLTLFHDRKVR